MKKNFIELKKKDDLVAAIEFVLTNFLQTEKNSYVLSELKDAAYSLQGFDIFNSKELEKLVIKGRVKVIACKSLSIVGVCAFEPKSGKILFIAAQQGKTYHEILNALLEKIIEDRASGVDGKLNIMAFVGQVNTFLDLGFKRLFDTVLYYRKLKLVPMVYNYAQLDIEK